MVWYDVVWFRMLYGPVNIFVADGGRLHANGGHADERQGLPKGQWLRQSKGVVSKT